MKWYMAKIIFRVICGNGNHPAQFDEQLRVICAENDTAAFNKAYSLGEKEEDVFTNNKQELVQWKFINVSEMYQLCELLDGAEVYSRIEENDEPDNYVSIIHEKAMHIQNGSTHRILQLL